MENGSGLASPTQASSSRGNVLSSKLTSVLSRSYADPEIRDSLAILDEKGVVNDVKFRRRLWLDAHRDVIECNGAIVKDFGVVAEQLRRVGRLIGDLNKTCDAMKGQISIAHEEASPTLREASSLMVQKKEIESKQKVLKAFGQHFIISDEDLTLLTSSAEPVNDRYFQILNLVKQIRKDCEVLLGGEDQTLGLELMEQTSRNLNAAFEKLYAWIQREFKALDLDDPHISSSIRKALRVLAERPTMFENCLDFFAEARERILSDGFHAALNNPSDSSVSSAKPINLQTHDLMRYIGDMLAWIHSAAVSEREALEGLFMADGPSLVQDVEAGRAADLFSLAKKSSSSPSSPSEDFDAPKALAALVTRSLSGASRLLKSKIDIAIATADDPILVFKARGLLQFYTGIFGKLLGSGSALVEAFDEMQTQAAAHFERLLQDEVSTATVETTVPDQLDAPTVLIAALDRVVLLLEASPDIEDDDIGRLLTTALVPFLEICEKAVSSDTDLEDTEKGIFRLNYLLAVTSTLAPLLPSGHGFLTVAGGKAKTTKSALVAAQHAFLLRESGIQALLSAERGATNPDPKTPSDQQNSAPFDLKVLATAAAQLDAFLPSALMDVLENLKQLADRAVAKEIAAEAAAKFCVDFERVEERVTAMDADRDESEDEGDKGDKGEGEEREWAGEIFPRTTAEIRVLLS